MLGRGRRPGPLSVDAPAKLAQILRDGAAPLRQKKIGAKADLDVTFVIPDFRRGSGGHAAIAELVRGLEARGHSVTLVVQDPNGRHDRDKVDELFRDFFGPMAAKITDGAIGETDVLVATGWQTVPRVLASSKAVGRAYLVQDHEPEFYGTSAERMWAQWTYAQDLQCICSSKWLAKTVAERYGAKATWFDYGVDHGVYTALPTHRRDDLVLAYGRAVTERRAVPLAVLALDELHRRRPEVEIALFGESRPVTAPFPYRDLGVMDPEKLAHAYASATIGLVLSLTNPSLVPAEMLACGLPVVDARSESMLECFGDKGPIVLSELHPIAICEAIETLLDDLALRADASRAGAELVAGRTWDKSAEGLEKGLRAALKG